MISAIIPAAGLSSRMGDRNKLLLDFGGKTLVEHALIESADINRLIAGFYLAREQNKSIVVPFHQGQRGNPVILDSRFKASILDVVGDVGCRRIVKRNPDKVFVLEMDNDHVIRDIDSPEDYDRLLAPSPGLSKQSSISREVLQ